MNTFAIDPGHGGTRAAGSSTPFGVTGPTGLREKDVTLDVARRLVSHIGGSAVMTRDKDENLSLRQRIAIARRARTSVFLSIHANGGPPGVRGAQVWVHERSGSESATLAEALAGQLRSLGGGADVRRGPL